MSSIAIDELNSQMNNEENTKLRYITPILQERWGTNNIVMEYSFTDGRISVDEYNTAYRGKPKRVDYLMLWKDNFPLALVEAKGKNHRADEGYSQAVNYARLLDVPFAYTTNGDDLIERDMISGLNKNLKMTDFPYPEDLWNRYVRETEMSKDVIDICNYPYYITPTGKKPRYYQRIAINRAVEAIARGQNRVLLVLATGTGKTFCSFQIIYRFWKTRSKKKILYLADRNILIDQTMKKDFKPFADAMVKIDNKNLDTSRDIYLGLYQQLKSKDHDYYKKLPPDFFDLIIIDECHRGSANENSNWHDILTYFKSAVQIGMTATPKDGGLEDAIIAEKDAKERYETILRNSRNVDLVNQARRDYDKAIERRQKAEGESNQIYFGNPLYTYSLKQGIEDGFLAPYKVVSVELNIDKYGYRPKEGDVDTNGNPLDPNVVYTQSDFDRKIILPDRRKQVAKRITDFMKTNDMRYAKTIVFCEDIPHCEEMVRLLENENADLVSENPRYIVQITGDNDEGKKELDNFIEPTEKYPVIAVTSRLMSTGVDAETCEIVVLDRGIGSMTEFKQIVGRGTRIKQQYECDGEEKSKMYFTILDFRKNYLKFMDPEFDGDPVDVTSVDDDNEFPKPPIKPGPGLPKKPPKVPNKVVRVNGVDVQVIGEDVQYLDTNGNLVTQNISSCVKNNITSQYSTFEDFKKVWLLTKDKTRMANELLLDIEWGERFEIQYGYKVDKFDIIAYLGYDIEPPMSKQDRIQNKALRDYINTFNDETQTILNLLLDSYINNSFENLKDIKNIFSQPEFSELGYTPMKVIKRCFKVKEKYFKVLNELENKLYE